MQNFYYRKSITGPPQNVTIQQQNKASNPPLCENCHREALRGNLILQLHPTGTKYASCFRRPKTTKAYLSYVIIIHLSQNKITSAYLPRPEKCVNSFVYPPSILLLLHHLLLLLLLLFCFV